VVTQIVVYGWKTCGITIACQIQQYDPLQLYSEPVLCREKTFIPFGIGTKFKKHSYLSSP